jgi:hypothetical protein
MKQYERRMKDSRKRQRKNPSQNDQMLAFVYAKMILIPGTSRSRSKTFLIIDLNIIRPIYPLLHPSFRWKGQDISSG